MHSGHQGRRLHGRRGLKCVAAEGSRKIATSPPSRAAWIEIIMVNWDNGVCLVAAFTGGVD